VKSWESQLFWSCTFIGVRLQGADSPRSKIPGILLLTSPMGPTMNPDRPVNLWMWSGVDETPLDSSFVYPYDSVDLPQDGILGQVAGINSISLLASNIRRAMPVASADLAQNTLIVHRPPTNPCARNFSFGASGSILRVFRRLRSRTDKLEWKTIDKPNVFSSNGLDL
jgi:hypothetical protein